MHYDCGLPRVGVFDQQPGRDLANEADRIRIHFAGSKKEGTHELEATVYALVPDSASSTARQRIDSYTQTIKVSVKAQTWSEWLKSAREEIDAVQAIAIALGGVGTAVLGWLGISASRRSRSRRKSPKPSTRAA